MKRLSIYFILLSTVFFFSCSQNEKGYKIGVSQCGEGQWRDKVNKEMLAAQHLYEKDVKVTIANAHDDTQRQIHQIDSLVDEGIDLLVVAPNESAPIADAIARVQKKGIPVVFFDRKAETNDYTAFIGGSNVEAGLTVGNYTLSLAKNMHNNGKRPCILEITGAMSSSPAQERHEGFAQTMANHKELNYICKDGDWTSDKAYKTVIEQIEKGFLPDIVFCHNDGMATGVYKAIVEKGYEGKINIIGIDGLPDEGIEYVKLGHQVGTYVYPTHGEEIVRLALRILMNQSYERDNLLQGVMVTPENADMMAMNNRELMKQNTNLITIHEKLERAFGLYNTQHKLLTGSLISILLLVIAILLILHAIRQIKKAHRQIKAKNEEQTLFYTNASHQLKTPLTLIDGPVKKLLDDQTIKGEQRSLLEIVSRNVSQLQTLISSVLNFKKGMQAGVKDDNADSSIKQLSSTEVVQEGHLNMLKHDDTEELANILIVDDNDDMRRYLRTLLADKFYVIEASDGQSGLKLARESVPDIVVSDVMMPIMDGLQFCRQLKEDSVTSHIPVILLTARSTETQQIEGYEHGADAYVTKPFNADLLTARIYNLLKSRQQLRNLFDIKQEKEDEEVAQLSTQDKLFADSLKEAIKIHMSNPNLKMDDLGNELGLSRVQLYRKVKALTGLSPVELLRQMRLQKAYKLLGSTTKTVAEIAYEVGFGTPGYFSNCFKKQYGKYPTDLRTE